MKHIGSFHRFLRESVEDQQPQDFRKVAFMSNIADEMLRFGVWSNLNKLYVFWRDPYTSPDAVKTETAETIPVLMRGNTAGQKFINATGYPLDAVYNMPTENANKLFDYKLIQQHGDFSWMPKTVYTIERARETIGFPLIAKVPTSMQSSGVELLRNERDFTKQSVIHDFEIFQKPIDIAHEWRALCFRGKRSDDIKFLSLNERIPENDKSRSLRLTEPIDEAVKKEKSHFTWVQQDPRRWKHIDTLTEIASFFYEQLPGLNLAGFDIAEDTSGNAWFIEKNMMPGQVGSMVLLVYKCVFEDWYNRPLSGQAREALIALIPHYNEWSIEEEEGRFKPNDALNDFIDGITLNPTT